MKQDAIGTAVTEGTKVATIGAGGFTVLTVTPENIAFFATALYFFCAAIYTMVKTYIAVKDRKNVDKD